MPGSTDVGVGVGDDVAVGVGESGIGEADRVSGFIGADVDIEVPDADVNVDIGASVGAPTDDWLPGGHPNTAELSRSPVVIKITPMMPLAMRPFLSVLNFPDTSPTMAINMNMIPDATKRLGMGALKRGPWNDINNDYCFGLIILTPIGYSLTIWHPESVKNFSVTRIANQLT